MTSEVITKGANRQGIIDKNKKANYRVLLIRSYFKITSALFKIDDIFI